MTLSDVNQSKTVRDLIAAAVTQCGGSETKLGQATGYSQNAIWAARRRGSVTLDMADRIDRATNGQVPRWKLRPDVFAAPLNAECISTADNTSVHGAGSSADPKTDTQAVLSAALAQSEERAA